ncbi:MAG: hypothetical protein WBG46_01925 [Nonlabens sp.]
MISNQKTYYKIVSDIFSRGAEINTADRIDYNMVARISELNKLFNLIDKCSEYHNVSIREILQSLKLFDPSVITGTQLFLDLKEIKEEKIIQEFNIINEFRYFTYFILEKVRLELLKNNEVEELPNRFESSYFFGSLADCKRYLIGLNLNYSLNKLKVIEVKFEYEDVLFKFDNNHLSNFEDSFHSKDFKDSIARYLRAEQTQNPLFEYVFQGRYRIVNTYMT